MNLFVTNFFRSFCSFFSGGIFCDGVGILCGGTAIGVSGAIYREGHTFVLTHGVTANNVAGSVGLDYVLLLFSQRPSQCPSQTYSRLKGRAVPRKRLLEGSQRNEPRVRQVLGCSLQSPVLQLAALRGLKRRRSPRNRHHSFPLNRTVKKREGIISGRGWVLSSTPRPSSKILPSIEKLSK